MKKVTFAVLEVKEGWIYVGRDLEYPDIKLFAVYTRRYGWSTMEEQFGVELNSLEEAVELAKNNYENGNLSWTEED